MEPIKRHSCCCDLPSSLDFDNPLIGCNGKPHSIEFLQFLLSESEKEQKYEMCKIYHDEINRLKNLNQHGSNQHV